MSTAISPRHAAARDYARRGIPVFPVEVNGKLPLPGSHAYKDATTDLTIIDKRWGEADYNLALSPEDAGWAVLDPDQKEGRNGIANLAAAFPDLPKTFTVRTPTGGLHLYFIGSLPADSTGKVAQHVDTRGRGSYVVVPPSVIDGKEYEVIDDRDLAVLPVSILACFKETNARASEDLPDIELDSRGNVNRARHRILDQVRGKDASIEAGTRDNRTYQIGCKLSDNYISQEMAFTLLSELWNPHCEPPLTEEELRACIEHAYTYKQNAPGVDAVREPEDAFAEYLAKHKDDPEDPELSALKRRFKPKDVFEQEKEKPSEWLVPGLIVAGQKHLWYADKGALKTFLAMDISLGVSTGKLALGVAPLATGFVFYGALEGMADICTVRRAAWEVKNDMRGKMYPFYVMPAPQVRNPEEIKVFGDWIRDTAKGQPIKLIVIDTLAKATKGMEENSVKEMADLDTLCDSLIREFGCAVLVLHHTKKGAKEARGSGSIPAGFDSVLRIDRVGKTRRLEVYPENFRDANVPEDPLTFEAKLIKVTIQDQEKASLIIEPTERHEHAAAIAAEDPYDASRVFLALAALAAFDPQKVARLVVARQLLGPAEFVSVEAEQAELHRIDRKLAALSKQGKPLRRFCPFNENEWFLPAKEN